MLKAVESGNSEGNGEDDKVAKDVRREIHQTIQTVTEHFEEGQSFNVAIAQMMKLSNTLSSQNSVFSRESCASNKRVRACREEGVHNLLLLLLPFAPTTATELLEKIKLERNLTQTFKWPKVDNKALIDDVATVVLQVKGKKKAVLEVPLTSFRGDKTLLEKIVMESDETQNVLKGEIPKRVIVVVPKAKKGQSPVNIVNFVM